MRTKGLGKEELYCLSQDNDRPIGKRDGEAKYTVRTQHWNETS